MDLPVFPNLDGLELNTIKRADFKTAVFEALSGHESRFMLRQYPKYTFKVSFEFLIEDRDEAQLTELLGFMLKQGGMYSAFLYSDPSDNAVIDQQIGVGDGVKTAFQLVRNYGGFVEPTENINLTPTAENAPAFAIAKNELTQISGYNLSASGLVTFADAPASGTLISWTGNYYYRVRFVADGYDFSQLMSDWHECKDIEFVGSTRNIV